MGTPDFLSEDNRAWWTFLITVPLATLLFHLIYEYIFRRHVAITLWLCLLSLTALICAPFAFDSQLSIVYVAVSIVASLLVTLTRIAEQTNEGFNADTLSSTIVYDLARKALHGSATPHNVYYLALIVNLVSFGIVSILRRNVDGSIINGVALILTAFVIPIPNAYLYHEISWYVSPYHPSEGLYTDYKIESPQGFEDKHYRWYRWIFPILFTTVSLCYLIKSSPGYMCIYIVFYGYPLVRSFIPPYDVSIGLHLSAFVCTIWAYHTIQAYSWEYLGRLIGLTYAIDSDTQCFSIFFHVWSGLNLAAAVVAVGWFWIYTYARRYRSENYDYSAVPIEI